jgi:hypothetical protein
MKYLLPLLSFVVFPTIIYAAWPYDQDFEALSTGDLNGQDSWSADLDMDVTNVASFDGSQSVVSVAASGNGTRDITNDTSGTLYFSVMRPDTTSDASFRILNDSDNAVISLAMFSGNIYTYDNSTLRTLVPSYTNGTWYTFEVEYDSNTDTHYWRYVVGTSTSWSMQVGPYDYQSGNTGDISKVNINQGGSGTFYVDTITATCPFGCGGGGGTPTATTSTSTTTFEDDNIIFALSIIVFLITLLVLGFFIRIFK